MTLPSNLKVYIETQITKQSQSSSKQIEYYRILSQ